MKIALSIVSTSTATGLNSGDLPPQNNNYLAISGFPAVVVDPETRVRQAKAVGSVVYEGLKTVLQGLNDCSNMCPPLRTAVGMFLTIIKFVEVCVLVYNNNNSFIVYSCGPDRVGEQEGTRRPQSKAESYPLDRQAVSRTQQLARIG